MIVVTTSVLQREEVTSLEKWMMQGKAPALQLSLTFYKEVRKRGLKIFLISSRGEHTRHATIDNLVTVGYTGRTGLIMRLQLFKTAQVSSLN